MAKLLILFGSHGSPGTTTTAFLIASHWSERMGVERCLLIEADPTGGVLSSLLHLKPDKGIAPLLLSEESSIRIWDYTQSHPASEGEKLQILQNPHVLRSSWDTVSVFTHNIQEYVKNINQHIPIVIDAGRLFHTSPCLKLITEGMKPMLVVGEGNIAAYSSIGYFKEIAEVAGATAGLISVGSPLWSQKEYKDTTGVELISWVEEHPEGRVDLHSIEELARTAKSSSKIKAFVTASS